MTDAIGPVILITGANSGVGLAFAAGVLEKLPSYRVCLACRNPTRAEEAKKRLLEEHPGGKVEVLIIDVSCMKSVLKASQEFKERFPRLDALYLNAGIMPVTGFDISSIIDPREWLNIVTTGGNLLKQTDKVTDEGLQLVFATNLLGHFLLIQELTDLLEETRAKYEGNNGLIVWTGSRAAKKNSLLLNDIQHKSGVDPYGSSKRAIDILTIALNRELSDKGLRVYSTCPGLVVTGLTLQILGSWTWWLVGPILSALRLVVGTMTVTPENGAFAMMHILLEARKAPSTFFKYLSTTTVLGRNKIIEVPLKVPQPVLETLYGQLKALSKQVRQNA